MSGADFETMNDGKPATAEMLAEKLEMLTRGLTKAGRTDLLARLIEAVATGRWLATQNASLHKNVTENQEAGTAMLRAQRRLACAWTLRVTNERTGDVWVITRAAEGKWMLDGPRTNPWFGTLDACFAELTRRGIEVP